MEQKEKLSQNAQVLGRGIQALREERAADSAA